LPGFFSEPPEHTLGRFLLELPDDRFRDPGTPQAVLACPGVVANPPRLVWICREMWRNCGRDGPVRV
jgi:hypothetical protein